MQSPSFFLSFFAMKTHWPAGWLSRSGVALALGREISVQRRAKKARNGARLGAALRCRARKRVVTSWNWISARRDTVRSVVFFSTHLSSDPIDRWPCKQFKVFQWWCSFNRLVI